MVLVVINVVESIVKLGLTYFTSGYLRNTLRLHTVNEQKALLPCNGLSKYQDYSVKMYLVVREG